MPSKGSLEFHVDASSLLPVDDISDGFDNIASVLKVSPSFLDQYISAARAVTSRALGNPTARPVGFGLPRVGRRPDPPTWKASPWAHAAAC